jgi:hypothetical protein
MDSTGTRYGTRTVMHIKVPLSCRGYFDQLRNYQTVKKNLHEVLKQYRNEIHDKIRI